MITSKKYLIAATLLALVAVAGCGSSNQAVAPPGGGFSNSNLNGNYIFSFSGYDLTDGNESFFAMLGSLAANGSGSFTGGTIDIDDPALGAARQTSYVFQHLPVTGSYNITSDGRGTGTITATINGIATQFGLDFVLTSNAHGLMTRFDNSGTGSGTLDLQAANIIQSELQGSYAFGMSGVDSTIANPLATVGSFMLDSNGNITTGSQDFSDNGNSRGLRDLGLSGIVTIGSPGTAQLATSAAGFETLHFDVWPIDSTHLKLIETDGAAYLEGDAFVSTGYTSFPSGPLVYTLSGEDTAEGAFAAGGLLASDGSSQITGGLEDVNDEGYVAQAPSVHGSFTSSGARTVLTLNGIYNGNFYNNAMGSGDYTFAAYPFNGGIMLLEIDNGAGNTLGISGGNIYPQTATSITTSQGYGLNMTGVNAFGETDWIAEFTATANTMSGLYDANNSGYLVPNFELGTGNYSVSSNGRGTITFPALQINGNSAINALNLTFYVINDSTAVFLETDENQLATGTFQLQNASSEETASPFSPAAQSPFVVMHPLPSVPSALRLGQ